ncbi:hypothetical protein EWM64_g345 [Hericium alpestre]|uniref:Uncharacterized protein n=1 Tax=Hericium alpestre TaxID=135208 RepID=A0A4Z0AAT0_9AGAM|nr:hypothetical protein EWM64_g345 [Hericium alpestre]
MYKSHSYRAGAATVDPRFELNEATRLSREGLISLQDYSVIAHRATNAIVEEGKRKQALIDQYIGRTPTPAELQRDFGYTPEQLQAGVDYYMRLYNIPVENVTRSQDRPRNNRISMVSFRLTASRHIAIYPRVYGGCSYASSAKKYIIVYIL